MLQMLKGIKFLLAGLLVDSLMLGGFFICVWKWLARDDWAPSTFDEYADFGVFVLWISAQFLAWLWPVSIPLLVAPPAVGLWMDLKDHSHDG
jgi:hypothetical protein